MKKLTTILFIFLVTFTFAQPTGYYNGTEGKTGEELKSELNDIISNHMEWAYFYAKKIFLTSDADPANPGNVIAFYKGTSVDGQDYGTGGNQLNREHVWAKSHGQFGESLPTGADAHNLHPADGSVNVDRSNKDFDNCQENGTQHSEATGCYFTDDAWEPRDQVKGDVARTIFYMATRYEGEDGQVDLEVNDELNNSPDPFHGRLSALLEWNEQDPPDNFERNRNNVIFDYQQNRNPFVDNPEWVNMIWGSVQAGELLIGELQQSIELPVTGQSVDITATIQGTGTVSATIKWGTEYSSLSNTVTMTDNSGTFGATIPSQTTETDIFYQVEATDDNGTNSSVVYSYHVEAVFDGTIMTIAEIQGEQAASPYLDQEVTFTGVVTANFGEGFFIQDGQGAWNGIYVYDVINPQIGDSVIVTGTVAEYYELTEIIDVSDFYLISRGHDLPAAEVLQIDQVSEAYEGVLINIPSGTCSSDDEGYGMWQISDNTGDIKVHNTQIYEFEPQLNNSYSITGPLKWDYGEWKIELRMPSDVAEGNDDIKPEVESVEVVNNTSITVFFSEPIDETTSVELSNYSINNNIAVNSATLNTFTYDIVSLTVDNMASGEYETTISNVQDQAGNVMETQTIPFTVGVGIDDLATLGVQLYPNPVTNRSFSINNTRDIAQVRLTDISGKTFLIKENNTKATTMQFNNLPHGMLFVHLRSKDGHQAIKKIIVE